MEWRHQEYIPPDYTGFPGEDDEDEFDEDFDDELLEDESEIETEQVLDNNVVIGNNNSTPFGNGTSAWGSGGNTSAPWEKPVNNQPAWGSAWGSNNNGTSAWGQSSWGSNNNSMQNNEGNVAQNVNLKKKRILICNALDCVVESYDSNGKPGILPRAVFDFKPRFDIWERLASFGAEKVYLIFPPIELIPGLTIGNLMTAMNYISSGLAAFLRIPSSNCIAVSPQDPKSAMSFSMKCLIPDVNAKNKDDIVFVGVHSGRWGLSSLDLDTAHALGIDYIDMFSLMKGFYQYE